MTELLLEHLTLPYVLTLIAGLVLGVALGYVVDWVQRKRGKPARRQSPVVVVAGLVIVLTMVWIMVSTNQARQCAINLNVAVAREQAIAKIERDSFAKAIIQSQSVDPAIADLPQSDPVRKAVFDPITQEYLDQQAKAAKMREDNAVNRDAAQRACGTKK